MKKKLTHAILLFILAAGMFGFGIFCICYVRINSDSLGYNGMGFVVAAIIMFGFGIPVLCGAIGQLVKRNRLMKRMQAVRSTLAAQGMGDAIYLLGTYGEKNANAKAAAKTAGSAALGALFAMLFGFGVHKVYKGAQPCEFVLGSGGIHYGNPNTKHFSLDALAFLPGYELVRYEIGGSGKIVTLTLGNEQFVLSLDDTKQSRKDVLERLEAMKQGASVADLTVSDPFEL